MGPCTQAPDCVSKEFSFRIQENSEFLCRWSRMTLIYISVFTMWSQRKRTKLTQNTQYGSHAPSASIHSVTDRSNHVIKTVQASAKCQVLAEVQEQDHTSTTPLLVKFLYKAHCPHTFCSHF